MPLDNWEEWVTVEPEAQIILQNVPSFLGMIIQFILISTKQMP